MTLASPLPLVDASARTRYRAFIGSCMDSGPMARLTPRADASAFALCFAIFGLHLVQDSTILATHRDAWDAVLREAVARTAQERAAHLRLDSDKHYLQLLTFTLSALTLLGTLAHDPLADLVRPLLPTDTEASLRATGADRGLARSGNQAMFQAILLLHARDALGEPVQDRLQAWVACHHRWMNRFGFWGADGSMSHLQFQNGYHQYEVLEYLGDHGTHWDRAADAVASLADDEGHFAPYPGGGGCYDYDAVFLLTAQPAAAQRHADLLRRTARTLQAEQNSDGGFAESLRIRPRSLANLQRAVKHALAGSGQARNERWRQALTLQRPRHDRIDTHWSSYSRGWGESDLWDAWFRMLALARIDCALNPAAAARWGFIPFPGIGFHPSAVHKGSVA